MAEVSSRLTLGSQSWYFAGPNAWILALLFARLEGKLQEGFQPSKRSN